MKKLFPFVLVISALFSCNAQSSQKNKGNASSNKSSNMEEGKDYVILKRFRVEDKQGFSEPIEVSSFLLPANIIYTF